MIKIIENLKEITIYNYTNNLVIQSEQHHKTNSEKYFNSVPIFYVPLQLGDKDAV
jgi:hypothetical protein